MARFPYQFVNINGLPTVESQGVTVTDTAVNFKFNGCFGCSPMRGLILVYLSDAIPTGTTETLPITFTMASTTRNVTVAGGENLTVADLPGTGVYILYYDRFTDVLQLIGPS